MKAILGSIALCAIGGWATFALMAQSPAIPSSRSATQFNKPMPTVFPGAAVPFPKVRSWVQGEPQDHWEPGKTYFIDFFATTCTHCEENAPLIAELARTYQPKGVVFIAISKEDRQTIAAWLEIPLNKERVNYGVISDPGQISNRVLQNGTFRNSTPRVFMVKDGIVQWIGHPALSEKPLEALVNGTWDPATIRDDFTLDCQVEIAKDLITESVRQGEQTKRWSDCFALIDSISEQLPKKRASFEVQRFTIMIGIAELPKEGYALGRELARDNSGDISTLRALARTTLNSPFVRERDLDFAFEIAQAAHSLGKGEDPRAAEVLALAYFSKGERENALKFQEEAIRLQTEPKLAKQYRDALRRYKSDPAVPQPYAPPKITSKPAIGGTGAVPTGGGVADGH